MLGDSEPSQLTAGPIRTLRLALLADLSAARLVVADVVVPAGPVRTARAEVPRVDRPLLPVLDWIIGHGATVQNIEKVSSS